MKPLVVKLDAVEAAPLDPDPEADAPFSPVMLEPGSEVEGFLRGSVLLTGPALRLPALGTEGIEEDDGMVKTRRKTLLQSRRTLENDRSARLVSTNIRWSTPLRLSLFLCSVVV